MAKTKSKIRTRRPRRIRRTQRGGSQKSKSKKSGSGSSGSGSSGSGSKTVDSLFDFAKERLVTDKEQRKEVGKHKKTIARLEKELASVKGELEKRRGELGAMTWAGVHLKEELSRWAGTNLNTKKHNELTKIIAKYL
jgi:hypothetical protein